MAITFKKEPSGIYPAYNDAYIEFRSTILNDNRAEITVDPFPRVFLIYPNYAGVYLFNMKEAVRAVFNQNGFEDSNFDLSVYFKSIQGLYLSQEIEIKVLTDTTSVDTLSKTYTFFKAVKQIGEPIFSNPFRLLSNTADGVNFALTYFEGFPFSFDILKATSGKVVTVKSLNTGVTSDPMMPTLSDSFRINVDKGGSHNWTYDNILPLITGLNRLEIYEDGAFKTNLLINKKKQCSGVYLKWFNRHGGFSHYLFNKYFIQQTTGSEAGKVYKGEINNIAETTGNFKSIGKDVKGKMTIKAKYLADDYEILKDIFSSPIIQMYTSRQANVEGRFIDVIVDGSISYSNKRHINDISLIVELPEVITAKL